MKTIATFLFMAVICFITSIKALAQEQQSKEQLEKKTKVYPVPAKSTEQVNVVFDQSIKLQTVQLIKIDGWLPGGWLQISQNQTQTSFLLPKLSSGSYVLRFVKTDGQTFSKKIVINK